MKIATWNLERPKKPKTSSMKNKAILEMLGEVNADILILTETNSCIHPGEDYEGFPSTALVPSEIADYSDGENRTTIWSKKKFAVIRQISTWDPSTSICIGLQTPCEELLIYGTVIGIRGHKDKEFIHDLEEQIADWKRISCLGKICIAGDFNTSFGGYCLTKEGRTRISECFAEIGVDNLTQDIPGSADHIAISKSFLSCAKCKLPPSLWNLEKGSRRPRLSDHIGLSITLEQPQTKTHE